MNSILYTVVLDIIPRTNSCDSLHFWLCAIFNYAIIHESIIVSQNKNVEAAAQICNKLLSTLLSYIYFF